MNIYDYISYIDLIGWIGNFCFVTGGLLLAKKKIFGWTYQILGNLSYLIQGLFLSVTSLWILSCLLIGMNIYGIFQWRKKKTKKIRDKKGDKNG